LFNRSSIEIWDLKNPPSPYHIQALVESILGLSSLGKVEGSVIISAKWTWKGPVAAFYNETRRSLMRRLTGGLNYESEPGDHYIAMIVGTNSLTEAEVFLRSILRCSGFKAGNGLIDSGSGVYGVTRFGRPGTKAPGLLEVFMKENVDLSEVVECLFERKPQAVEIKRREDPDWASLSRSANGFSSITWRSHSLSALPFKSSVQRGPFSLKIGLAEVDCYISHITLSGTFFASPPSEPFTALSSLLGMPIDKDMTEIISTRIESYGETIGIKPEDFVAAIRKVFELTPCI